MGKYLWLVAGLALLGVLAFTGWQLSLDRGAEAEGRSAAAAAPDTKRGKHDDQGLRLEPTSKPARTSASAVPQLSTASRASSSGDQGEPGKVDVRWQAAVGLPQQVREQLGSSHDPLFQEMLQRNSRLTKPRADDTWGPEMQERLNEFFESRSAAESMQITVACREVQCQVQAMSLVQPDTGSTTPSQALFDELRQHWWFRERLTMAQGHVTTVDGRLYHLQYFDRKQ
jgi:hypothetical protein